MNPISSVASTVSQQTIAALQAQMVRYSQAANGQNSQASADYKALQTAIKSANVPEAQAALARLRRDSQAANPAAAKLAAASATANSPEGSDGSTGAVRPGNAHAIDLTA